MRSSVAVGLLLCFACSSSSPEGAEPAPPFSGAPGDTSPDPSAAGGTGAGPDGTTPAAVDSANPGEATLPTNENPVPADTELMMPPTGEQTTTDPATGVVEGPVLSAGCGKAGPPEGELSLSLNGVNAAYTVTLPDNYDPAVPVPLVFGFHGRNQTHIQFRTQDASNIETELGSRAVMAYLKSQGGPGWNFAEEVEPNVAFFEALYPQMLDNYCIDTSRVFAVGHSSGGYFSNILACRFGDRLRGIASIAGQTQEFQCVGRVAALIIHGVRDSVVSFAGGQMSRDTYLATNGCTQTSVPTAVSPCIEYQGCAEGLPVQWCEHNEPTYQDTNHGWPSFASRAAGQFLFALP